MLGHSCGVSRYHQFYDTNNNKIQTLPHPYFGRSVIENGYQFFQEPWIIALAESVETFINVSINDMPAIIYWKIL